MNVFDLFNQPPICVQVVLPENIKPTSGERAYLPAIPRLVLPKDKKFHSKNKLAYIRKLAIWKGIFVFYDNKSMPSDYMNWTNVERRLRSCKSLAKQVQAIQIYTVRGELKWNHLYKLDVPLPQESLENVLRLLKGTIEQKTLARQILRCFLSNETTQNENSQN